MSNVLPNQLIASTAKSYDEVPYVSGAFPETDPARLASVGTLFGLQPVDPLACRVLELGCAQGNNLIPLACSTPQSQFLGIDLSEKQIAVGQSIVNELGLDNVQLRQQNILEMTDDIGSFDYIIAHGVLSWVPDVVRDKIFDLCQQLLSPRGIAYLSYNTYPGWHFRDLLRNQLRYHTRHVADERSKIAQAEQYLDTLALVANHHQGIYGQTLQAQLDLIKQSSDYYFCHELLEEVNQPFYFSQVAAEAERRGLQYLGDTDFSTMLTNGLTAEMTAKLKEVSHNLLETEQYLDFFRNRTFRRSLFCRDDIILDRSISTRKLMTLYLSSRLRTSTTLDRLTSGKTCSFTDGKGGSVDVSHPLSRFAFVTLSEMYPARCRFDELIRESQTRLLSHTPADRRQPISETDIHTLGQLLIKLYSHKLIEMHAAPLHATHIVGDRPRAFSFARRQALEGMPHVTTCRHDQLQLYPQQRELISLLDGTRGRDDLRRLFAAREGIDATAVDCWLDETLEIFRRHALLVD